MDILLTSFLSKLHHSDRKMYFFAAGFMSLQVILTVLKLEVTPVFLYGMYSEKIPVTNEFQQLNILINDKSINFYRPSFRLKALLTTNLANYEEMKINQHTDVLKTRLQTQHPYLFQHLISPIFGESIYNSSHDQEKFLLWLKQKCLSIAKESSGTVKIVRSTYLYNESTHGLKLVKNETLENL